MEGSCGERLEHISVEELCNTFSFQDNINIHWCLRSLPFLENANGSLGLKFIEIIINNIYF